MTFFYYTFGLFMMTEKRLSTDFAMHNHLKTAKIKYHNTSVSTHTGLHVAIRLIMKTTCESEGLCFAESHI